MIQRVIILINVQAIVTVAMLSEENRIVFAVVSPLCVQVDEMLYDIVSAKMCSRLSSMNLLSTLPSRPS